MEPQFFFFTGEKKLTAKRGSDRKEAYCSWYRYTKLKSDYLLILTRVIATYVCVFLLILVLVVYQDSKIMLYYLFYRTTVMTAQCIKLYVEALLIIIRKVS